MSSVFKSDAFWSGIVASVALSIGSVVLIGKVAPQLIGINQKAPQVVVVDPNAVMLKVAQLPQGANDPGISKQLVDQVLSDLAAKGMIVLDKRAVLSSPEGHEIDVDVLVKYIGETAPMPEINVPKLDLKPASQRDENRPAVHLNLTEEQLRDLAKKPQTEEDLKKTAEAINQFADLLEQMQALQKQQESQR